ncbi:uncharacterized protein BJ212DRAFT_1307101 [Suillus subaureus]|uniref:Uncharacterized protein n=1 Tax=Suillus subaureus TaxID=48587 RepID=A0A9P7APA3_9AGAM|nr:uncharacterized protein BJ212DRAFT_1307101 [Suillus subaureus]KAG1793573.1 hypothetical protein BJ212DRAFT_1307101 [Suillus subaureus]
MALQSETHVEIPWSDWGPQHTCCFPHERSHKISVFGSRMAYTPEAGQRLEKLSPQDHFYVHIWDFNKRAIARLENFYNPDSPGLLIRKPGRVFLVRTGTGTVDIQVVSPV